MKTILFILFLTFSLTAKCQQLPYKDAALPVESRVQDLLSWMTPEEKFRQLFMVAGELGKDSLRFRDGLFGFQINTLQFNETASNQMMQYAAGPSAGITLAKINSMQRFFVEETRL